MPALTLRKFLAPGLALATILIAGAFAWQRTETSPGGTATASTQGDRHQRIDTGSPLMVRFSAPMDEESVATYLTIDPPVEGVVEWKDKQTLSFHPSAPLSLSGTYTLTVSPEAQRRDRAVLGTSIVIKYLGLT